MSRFWYNLRVKKILAVSGGVDSMVLLDMFCKSQPDNILVAHFNHGTRESADLDEEFVKQRCKEYGVPFESSKMILGEGVSEEEAREKRYAFLYHVANKYQGEICTAHHLDDLLESVVINLIRGTFWRGLAPFGNSKIRRPLVDFKMNKTDILRYAGENHLCFRQDPTNYQDDYLRNRVRESLKSLEKEKKVAVLELAEKQRSLREEIEKNLGNLLETIVMKNSQGEIFFRRDYFQREESAVSSEILRSICLEANISLTRPQLLYFLEAIKNYQPGKKFNLPKDKMATISRDFVRL